MKARKKRLRPIQLDVTDGQGPLSNGQSVDSYASHRLLIEASRVRLLDREQASHDGHPVMLGDGHPLGDGFLFLPERLLRQYEKDRKTSVLARIFRTAHRIHERVDRVVVLHSGESQYAARAIMESCSQPYWNELSRGERGSRPGMYFLGDYSDNDSVQGLLHLLRVDRRNLEQGPGARWALVVVDRSGDTPEVLSMARFLFKAMHEAGVDASLPLGELIIPVVGEGSQLDRWTSELGCVERFLLSDRWESRYGAMSEECMLPAALLGVNVIELLIGSAELAIQFRDASFEDNIAMRLACVGHWVQQQHRLCLSLVDSCEPSMDSLVRWSGQLRSSLELPGLDSVFVEIEQPRYDLLHEDEVNADGRVLFRDARSQRLALQRESVVRAGKPTSWITLRNLDELHLGQLMQLLMVVTAMELEVRRGGVADQSFEGTST